MELIVFSGIQGSGKTTFYRDRFLATHVRLSLDLLKTRHREDILLHACLAAQQPTVIDNTNPTAAARSRYARLGRAAGFRTTLYFFDVPTGTAVARNAGRADKARVPNVAIFGTQKKLERPTAAEGFDEILRVSAGEDSEAGRPTFVVEPWREDLSGGLPAPG